MQKLSKKMIIITNNRGRCCKKHIQKLSDKGKNFHKNFHKRLFTKTFVRVL